MSRIARKIKVIKVNFMKQKSIYLCLAHMGGREQKYIQEAFDTNWVVPLGPNVNGFEADLCEYLTSPKKEIPNQVQADKTTEVVALSAGTAAVHLGLIQLGVGQGDEVVCQSFTFCASANPICYQGATPVFVDSEKDTWNMSPELLEQAIQDRIAQTGKKPKAIIVVHLYGMPAQMDEIMAVANRYEIPILEDAAEALGSLYKGHPCGTLGEFGVLSFNGNKMITTSGGGALVCPSVEAKQKTMFYATQARENRTYYQHEQIGYNYRMSNICAGIGRGQMEVLDEHIAHHRRLHSMYREAFATMEGITLSENPSVDFDSNFWLTTILVDADKTGFTHVELMHHLSKNGIETRELWKPLHLQPVFANVPSYANGVSEALFNQGLCLPSGPMVTDEDFERIISQIKLLYKG